MKKKVVVLSGAGISAESGLSTFRDIGGLWEGHDIMEVASPEGWKRNKWLVLEFYNKRRRNLLEAEPNRAHLALVDLEKKYQVCIITQNVDDLHERAGSNRVIHLHGELLKVRSTADPHLVYDWNSDLNLGDTCEKGSQLRPHVVWFGEEVPMMELAGTETRTADILIIVGTSLQVYPAAGLISIAAPNIPVFYIDPAPKSSSEFVSRRQLVVLNENASTGVVKVVEQLFHSE